MMGSMLTHSCGCLLIVFVALCAPDHLQLRHEDNFMGNLLPIRTSLYSNWSQGKGWSMIVNCDNFNYS